MQQNSGNSAHPLHTQTWNSGGSCHSSCLCPQHQRGRPVTKPGQSQYLPILGLSLSDYTRDWKRIHARKIHGPSPMGQLSFLVTQGGIQKPGRKVKATHREKGPRIQYSLATSKGSSCFCPFINA